MASSSKDNELVRSRGRPRKSEDELSVRSQRRRILEEITSLRAVSPPPPSSELPCDDIISTSPDISMDITENDQINTSLEKDEVEVMKHPSASTQHPALVPVDESEQPLQTVSPILRNDEVLEDTFYVQYDATPSEGALRFDCEFCLQCQCVSCNICRHSESGDCLHCDGCMFNCDSDVSEDEMSNVEDSDEGLNGMNDQDSENLSMKKDLREIFLRRKASHALIDDILHFLHKYNIGRLPQSAKTLLNTPTVAPKLRDVPPGQYWHCTITKHIVRFLASSDVTTVNITLSCDGVPIFNSAAKNFWPLTCSFNDSPEVFIIGVYLGNEKPQDPNDYLKDFVEEVIPLCQNGLMVKGKTVAINVVSAICDAPAKCFLLSTKSFNAYFSCSKCTTEGEMIGRRMTFPQLDAPLRSDESFVNHAQEDYHKATTILQNIPRFGCVTCVPLDYMHLLLLGIMRKLMYMWIEGPLVVRLPSAKVSAISDRLLNLAGWVPSDFARKPRSLQYIKRFKATEFRLIVLYVGVVVFHKILPRAIYEHFLVFHLVTTIYVDPTFSKEYLTFAKDTAKYFVETFADLYGQDYVSHNVHSFIHLGDDVEKFGTLDVFSAFKFENFYQVLLKLMRKGEKPLEQLVNRYSEMEACGFTQVTSSKFHDHISKNSQPFHLRNLHCSGPLLEGCKNPQYYSCKVQGGCIIKVSQADRCCMLFDKSVVLVENFATDQQGKPVLIGRTFRKNESCYDFPCKSSLFGIMYVKTLSNLQMWPVSLIKQKCFHMPWKSGFAVFPLHHNEQNQ